MSDKSALRADAKRVRASAFAANPHAAHELAASFLRSVAPGRRVAGYMPIGSEIDPGPLLALLAAEGVELALPVVRDSTRVLEFRAWRPGDALEPGAFGTQHPTLDSPVVRPDMVLVPLLAFDRRGHRLGYGGGFYDATLASLRADRPITAVGCAFAAQRVDALPDIATDQLLDWIVTEQDAHRFA
jgi:5-formyltetrahydrofolate cyclo-ligase